MDLKTIEETSKNAFPQVKMLFLLGEKRKNTFYDLSYFKIKKCNAVPAAGLI